MLTKLRFIWNWAQHSSVKPQNNIINDKNMDSLIKGWEVQVLLVRYCCNINPSPLVIFPISRNYNQTRIRSDCLGEQRAMEITVNAPIFPINF